MRRRSEFIVVFPRHTAFVGSGTVYSAPMDVRLFSGGVFTGWQGTGLGGPAAEVEYQMQMSGDLENWISLDVVDPPAESEESGLVAFEYAWMRWKATIAGSDPGVMGWLVGEIVYRDAPDGGGGA